MIVFKKQAEGNPPPLMDWLKPGKRDILSKSIGVTDEYKFLLNLSK
jgi:hypothetical protein